MKTPSPAAQIFDVFDDFLSVEGLSTQKDKVSEGELPYEPIEDSYARSGLRRDPSQSRVANLRELEA